MSAINTQWVTNLTAEINACPDCTTLQAAVTKTGQQMDAQINAAIKRMMNLAGLCTVPTNLSQVITYITAQRGYYLIQYTEAIAAQTALVSAYAGLISAINSKISALGCTITPPTIPVLPTPPYP